MWHPYPGGYHICGGDDDYIPPPEPGGPWWGQILVIQRLPTSGLFRYWPFCTRPSLHHSPASVFFLLHQSLPIIPWHCVLQFPLHPLGTSVGPWHWCRSLLPQFCCLVLSFHPNIPLVQPMMPPCTFHLVISGTYQCVSALLLPWQKWNHIMSDLFCHQDFPRHRRCLAPPSLLRSHLLSWSVRACCFSWSNIIYCPLWLMSHWNQWCRLYSPQPGIRPLHLLNFCPESILPYLSGMSILHQWDTPYHRPWCWV